MPPEDADDDGRRRRNRRVLTTWVPVLLVAVRRPPLFFVVPPTPPPPPRTPFVIELLFFFVAFPVPFFFFLIVFFSFFFFVPPQQPPPAACPPLVGARCQHTSSPLADAPTGGADRLRPPHPRPFHRAGEPVSFSGQQHGTAPHRLKQRRGSIACPAGEVVARSMLEAVARDGERWERDGMSATETLAQAVPGARTARSRARARTRSTRAKPSHAWAALGLQRSPSWA